MEPVPGTAPANNNDPAGEWAFINDVAVDGNKVIVATSDGLRYLQNGTWQYAQCEGADLVGNALEVKIGSDAAHTVVASVDGMIYIGTLDNMVCKSSASDVVGEDGSIEAIGTAAGLLDVAIAIDNEKSMIYAAAVNASGNHEKIYLSEDLGNTWTVILPTVSNGLGHQVYEGRGLYNHGLVVDPDNSNRLYVLAYNIWALDRPSSMTGNYMAVQISSAGMLHTGINAMAFDPRGNNVVYVATDGGIYKAAKAGDPYFSFTNCNRGYISTRCLAVAPSGKNTRVVAGLLDQGPILIEGEENLNNMETGELLLPQVTGAHYGMFSDEYNAGPCAVSLIQPKAIFATTLDGALWRTEDGGQNYDFANFTANMTVTYTGYRLPLAYWESFNDQNSVDEVWFKCTKNQQAGDVVQCISENGGYPFNYTLPIAMHYNPEEPMLSDSLLVKDIVTTKMVVPTKNGNDYEIRYAINGLKFNQATVWYKVAVIQGYPTCMTFSADGDNLFIGTLDHGLYRISNLRQAVDATTAHPDSANFAPVLTAMELPTTTQCVTSIAVYSEDANKIVVTMGNYGNDNYVLYSANALSSAPTFAEKQGNLPKMPVYSSVYTSTYDGANQGHVLIGTEHGIYRTTNIAAANPVWTVESTNMGDVPVLDLKQQLVAQEPQTVVTVIDSIPYETIYAGTDNQGVIYAATYGRGLFRCETYRRHTSVPETPAVVAQSSISMYPNPVRDEARVSFELRNSASVNIQVFDMSGRLVKSETLGNYTEGQHEVTVNMNGLAQGAYVLRLNAGSYTSSARFMMF